MISQPSDSAGAGYVALVANDHEFTARSLETLLVPAGFTVHRAFTGAQALERARHVRPDVIVLDAQLPDLHGLDVCRRLRADAAVGVLTPVVIATAGPAGRTQRIDAAAAGAWAFFGQPLDGEVFSRLVANFAEVRARARRLEDGALVESRSGLYTMRGLERRAREVASDARRREATVTCMVLALVDAGDDPEATADQLAEALAAAGRRSDVIGRLGVDEFAVIATGVEPQRMVPLLDRVRSALDGQGGRLSGALRAGVASSEGPASGTADPLELVLRATSALQVLRHDASAGRVRLFDPTANGIASPN